MFIDLLQTTALFLTVYLAYKSFQTSKRAAEITKRSAEQARRHDRLSVVPLLGLGWKLSFEAGTLEVFIRNLGLGPAWVEKPAVLINGEEYDFGKLVEVFDTLGTYKIANSHFVLSDNFTIANGEKQSIISVKIENFKELASSRKKDKLRKIADLFDGLEVRLDYGSFYQLDDAAGIDRMIPLQSGFSGVQLDILSQVNRIED